MNAFREKQQFNFLMSIYCNSIKCTMCKMNHLFFKGAKFKELKGKDVNYFVRKNKLCVNCLSDKHFDSQCDSTFICHYCQPR